MGDLRRDQQETDYDLVHYLLKVKKYTLNSEWVQTKGNTRPAPDEH